MRNFGGILFSAASAAAGGGVLIVAGTLLAAVPARAQDCPGNPDALGTSRVLTLEPGEQMRVGRLQYPQTLPLADHEVVLTFDDGPLPPSSNKILDILASQCIKATYFLVGEMARNFPATVRRIYREGHTIGTHSEDHPTRFDKLPVERVRQEIDEGIADVSAALGDPTELAPFFRIPGLGRTDMVESELAARGLVVFSVDAVADDWHRRIKPAQIIARAMSRLEARGKGILLLHDIHPATAAALPGLLKELKAQGFRIVQVVPAAPSAPEMIAGTAEWTVAWSTAEQSAIDGGSSPPNWPMVDVGSVPALVVLPAPDVQSFDIEYSQIPTVGTGDIEADLPSAGAGSDTLPWPDQSFAVLRASNPQLAALSVQDIGLPLAMTPLVSEAIATPPNSDSPGLEVTGAGLDVSGSEVPRLDVKTTEHGRLRHNRFHAHRHAHARAVDRHHA